MSMNVTTPRVSECSGKSSRQNTPESWEWRKKAQESFKWEGPWEVAGNSGDLRRGRHFRKWGKINCIKSAWKSSREESTGLITDC